MQYIYKKVYA